MKCYLYWNKSDSKYLNKNIVQVGNSYIEIELIKPTSIIHPTLIMSAPSRINEANYIYIEELARYYYIDDYTMEHNRIVVNCSVDVLMSHKKGIMVNEYIIERTNKEGLMNFYLHDPKLKELGYPYIEEHPLTLRKGQGFKMNVNEFLLGVAGAVTGSNGGDS